MASNNEALNTKLATTTNTNQAGNAVQVFEGNVRSWFMANRKKMNELLSEEESKRLMIVFLRVASQSPKILECTMQSVGNALMECAELGLYPGAMNEAALIPYGGKLKFIPQYQGLIKLAYNSGYVKSLNYGAVHEGDTFDWELGARPYLKHKPTPSEDDEERPFQYAYVAIENTFGGLLIVVKDRKFIEKIMNRSANVQMAKKYGKETAWDTDFDAMAIKTVLRQALNRFPKSEKLAKALQIENENERPELAKKQILDVNVDSVVNISPADMTSEGQHNEQGKQAVPAGTVPAESMITGDKKSPQKTSALAS